MRVYIVGLQLFAALMLVSCGGGDGQQDAGSGAPGDLCVSSSCGERVVLLDIPSAENQIFTDDGRLFVSDGLGVHEIRKDAAGAFSATLLDGGCGAGGGMAIRGNTLYVLCAGKQLFAGALTAAPVLAPIFALTGMCIPNGMTLGPDGNLYVVDEPLQVCVPDPKIVRLNLDPANPLHVTSQEVWVQGSLAGLLFLGRNNTLRFPNGLQRRGNQFFGTDGGSVYRVDLQADGSAGEVMPLFFEPSPHDDLGIAGDNLLVADFAGGRIFLMTQQGELLQETSRALFTFPSSVRLARPPMFQLGEILVTETGVLGDNNLPLDHLSLFRRKQ